MLTKVTIRNFKRFDDVEIELGNPVVFIGPNNSGKTTALQALALWDLGARRRREKGETKVALNRRDLVGLPVPDARMLLSDTAREHGSQVILASHSEVTLNEAADRDVVVAFLGKPHRIDDRGSQLLKSLKEIGFEQYYQAEQTGWVLYLEGSTDLAILRVFAEILSHPVQQVLERPFVHYVENQPRKAQEHFYGLREAKPDLQGFALFDRLTLRIEERPHLEQRMWRRREIESYLCAPETLMRWATTQEEQGGH